MKLKVIKIPFIKENEIDFSTFIDEKHNIIKVTNQIVIENEVAYNYLSIFYKKTQFNKAIYRELQEIETHKENLKQEIYNFIKEKHPSHKKIPHRRQDIADNYTHIKTIYDFRRIKNFGETTINKEKEILEGVLQIIKKYQLENKPHDL